MYKLYNCIVILRQDSRINKLSKGKIRRKESSSKEALNLLASKGRKEVKKISTTDLQKIQVAWKCKGCDRTKVSYLKTS